MMAEEHSSGVEAALRPDPVFIGGHPALDFLNSLAMPGGILTDWLVDGDDLLSWLLLAGLINEEAVHNLRNRAQRSALDQAAAEVRDLREWFRAFIKGYAGARLPQLSLDGLAKLNAILADDRTARQVSIASPDQFAPEGQCSQPLQITMVREFRAPQELVSALASEIAEFICGADFTLVRFCEGSICSLVFYDRTKNHRRRWCDMAICGNRSKQAAYRSRK